MATYFVGPGGNNGSDGLSYANRKLTLTGAAALALAAGDIIRVAPGTYRELLTTNLGGSSGNPITWVADTTGAYTDRVGGPIVVTASDDDIVSTRTTCMSSTASFVTVRGFQFQMPSIQAILITGGTNWIVEDCSFQHCGSNAGAGVWIAGATQASCTVRRCLFWACNIGVYPQHTATVDNSAHVVEQCLFFAMRAAALRTDRVGGISYRNCRVLAGSNGLHVGLALTAGQAVTIRECVFSWMIQSGFRVTTATEVDCDYCAFFSNASDAFSGVGSIGVNSVTRPPLDELPLLLGDGRVTWGSPFGQTQNSKIVMLGASPAGSTAPDIFGQPNVLGTARTWGPVQYNRPAERQAATVRTGTYAAQLVGRSYYDAEVPVTSGVATTIAVYVRWDSNASIGLAPQLIVYDEFGAAVATATAVGDGTSWEQLSAAFTPTLTTRYVARIYNRSTHTAAINAYADDLTRTP